MGVDTQTLFNSIVGITLIIQTMLLFKRYKNDNDKDVKNDIKDIKKELRALNIIFIKETTKSDEQLKSIWRHLNGSGPHDRIN